MIGPLIALCTAVAVVPLTIPVAHRLRAVARSGPDRWSRRSVTTLGGIGISAGLISGTVLAPLGVVDRLAIVAGVVVLVMLGLRDDLSVVSPRTRLGVQAVVGIVFAAAVTSGHPAFLLAVPLAGLAMPLAVNATNMVDNADALAATLSVVTATTLAGLAAAVVPSGDVSALAWIIVASCLGFMAYNLPPARVFMGDVGSLPLGFALAAASILLWRAATEVSGQTAAVVLFAIATAWAIQLGDVAMVFTTRLRRGKSPFRGGVDHTSHRLMRAGLSPGATVAFLALLAGACGLVGFLAATTNNVLIAVMTMLGVAAGVAVFESVLAIRTSHNNEPRSSNHGARRAPRRSRGLLGLNRDS